MSKDEIIQTLNNAYFSEECHEKEILEQLPELLVDTKVFVDIGASLGQYTFHANKNMRQGRIFAIEPDPIRHQELANNCRQWEAKYTNKIIPIHAAACDKDGKTRFYVTNSDVSGGLFTHDVSHKSVNWQEQVVNCLRLDTLFADESPDFIKIDVEGAELSVLKGAVNILERGRTRFLIEVHSFSRQVKPADVTDFMKSWGYFGHDLFGKILFTRSEEKSLVDKLKYCLAKLRIS